MMEDRSYGDFEEDLVVISRFGAGDKTCGEAQQTSEECTDGFYGDTDGDYEHAELSERARGLRKIFEKIARGEAKPLPPYEGAKGRHLVRTRATYGFPGAAGKDLSRICHLVLIPRMTEGVNGLDAANWVFDLETRHLETLEQLREDGLLFVRSNRDFFLKRFAHLAGTKDLKEKPVEHWLEEGNISFGFHLNPSIGYLHMHMLVGPVTDFGYEEKYKHNWISLSKVLEILKSSQSMATFLQTCTQPKKDKLSYTPAKTHKPTVTSHHLVNRSTSSAKLTQRRTSCGRDALSKLIVPRGVPNDANSAAALLQHQFYVPLLYFCLYKPSPFLC